jgi:hypothetical protein
MFTLRTSLRAAAVASLFLAACAAQADIVGDIIRIQMSDQDGNAATWAANEADGYGYWNESNTVYNWYLLAPVTVMRTDGEVLATISSLTLAFHNDPQVNLDFAVQAGTATTSFTMSSALLSFPTIAPAEGVASAAFSLTDTNGNGATLTGLEPSGGSYLAQYNGWVPGGTTFAEVIPLMAAGAFATSNASADVPPAGTTTIPSVSDMSSQVSFSLTRRDQASGTSTWVVTPEPGSLCLLALGLGLLRRR